ncbi:hypothetical protein HOH87_06660 [bacterium]|jgi:hypothetical protein|nr:hypothetical protein [bacterium]
MQPSAQSTHQKPPIPPTRVAPPRISIAKTVGVIAAALLPNTNAAHPIIPPSPPLPDPVALATQCTEISSPWQTALPTCPLPESVILRNGNRFTGTFHNNEALGYKVMDIGVKQFPDGSSDAGTFIHVKGWTMLHGDDCTRIHPDGRKDTGRFKYNKYVGPSPTSQPNHLVLDNGNHLEGHIVTNAHGHPVLHGPNCTATQENGVTLKGTFVYGGLTEGSKTYPNGAVDSGTFDRTKFGWEALHGLNCTQSFPDGSSFTGVFEHNYRANGVIPFPTEDNPDNHAYVMNGRIIKQGNLPPVSEECLQLFSDEKTPFLLNADYMKKYTAFMADIDNQFERAYEQSSPDPLKMKSITKKSLKNMFKDFMKEAYSVPSGLRSISRLEETNFSSLLSEITLPLIREQLPHMDVARGVFLHVINPEDYSNYHWAHYNTQPPSPQEYIKRASAEFNQLLFNIPQNNIPKEPNKQVDVSNEVFFQSHRHTDLEPWVTCVQTVFNKTEEMMANQIKTLKESN